MTRPTSRVSSWCLRLIFGVSLAVTTLLFLEVGSRAYWTVVGGTGFLQPDVIDRYYPQMRYLKDLRVRDDDADLDILLLGGSVVHPNWGLIPEFLLQEMMYRTRRTVWVHNLAAGGHTTRDSLEKYRRLDDHRFDVVLVYHGINETRANNCPPEVFSPSYSHYGWYRDLDLLSRHPEASLVTLPFTAHYLARRLTDHVMDRPRLAPGAPPTEWLTHGADVKSAASVEDNLSRIVELADRRRDPVILMTFAYYIDPAYSKDAFLARTLDYVRYGEPVELWGDPSHVAAAIDVHNEVVRRVSQTYQVPLVDQWSAIPQRGEFFNDVCHLSYKGCAHWVAGVADAIEAVLPGEPANRKP